MAIEQGDLQAIVAMLRDDNDRHRRETLDAVKTMIKKHEEAEVALIKKTIQGELHESHGEEHKFIQTWMHRMDSMGDGFFASIGKSLATLVFIGFAAAALASLGGNK